MFDHNGIRQFNEDGSHACETIDCKTLVMYDDEPYCFAHSPRTGSHFPDYSYRADTFHTFI
jgi:hypothetical protein